MHSTAALPAIVSAEVLDMTRAKDRDERHSSMQPFDPTMANRREHRWSNLDSIATIRNSDQGCLFLFEPTGSTGCSVNTPEVLLWSPSRVSDSSLRHPSLTISFSSSATPPIPGQCIVTQGKLFRKSIFFQPFWLWNIKLWWKLWMFYFRS